MLIPKNSNLANFKMLSSECCLERSFVLHTKENSCIFIFWFISVGLWKWNKDFFDGLFSLDKKIYYFPRRGFSKVSKEGSLGAFLMGVSFSLGFCPTMFVLFFITLKPMAISVNYWMILPSIFAIGTSLPLIIAVFLIWYLELGGRLMKKGRRMGAIVQKVTGIIMLIIGVLDTITYWNFS